MDEEENIHPVTFSDELNHKILNHLADFKSINGNWTWTNENSPYMLTRKFSKSEFDQQLHNSYYLKFTMNEIVREITRVFDDDVLWSQSNDKYVCFNIMDVDEQIKKNESVRLFKIPILRLGLRKDFKYLKIEILSIYKWECIGRLLLKENILRSAK